MVVPFNRVDKEKLKSFMDEKRFRHTLGVAETAAEIAQLYSVNLEEAVTAALLHDCARVLPPGILLEMAEKFSLPIDSLEREVPDLLHGKVGAEIARTEFGIDSPVILNAIRRHTLGDEKMTALDKVIFVADMIEPGRSFPGVDLLRKVAAESLDKAVLAGLNSTIIYVISISGIIHPKSIKARNAILLTLKNH